MKRPFVVAIVALVAITLIAGAFGGCAKKPADTSRELASVNTNKITENALNTRVNIFKMFYGPSVEEAETKENILSQMIEEALLIEEATNLKIKVSANEVTTEFNTFSEQLEAQFGDRQKMNTELTNLKLTTTDLKSFIERYMILQAVYKQVTEKTTVADDQITKYFDEHKDEFTEEESVRARHILVKTQEEADKILKELKAGGDFAALAKQYSTDPGSKDNGGDLGKFGRYDMVEEFGNVAFSTPAGQLSGVVKTDFGFHIIRVEEKFTARQLTFAEVKDQIKEMLLEEKRSEAFDNYVKGLQDKAKINRTKI